MTVISLIAKDNIKLLIDYVGSFAGVALMLIFTSIMIGKARKIKNDRFPFIENIHASVFKNKLWPIFLLIVSIFSIIIHFYTKLLNKTSINPDWSIMNKHFNVYTLICICIYVIYLQDIHLM